jgi:ribonuclease E
VADDSQTTVGGWVDNYYDIGPAAYLFVKTGDLSRPTYRDVIVQPSQDTEFYSRSKNVTSISFGGDIVTVNGPRYEQIASQAKIPTYKLNYVNESDGRFGIKTAGNELNVAAPAANLQRTASTQPKIEKTLAQAQVDDGWQKVNKEQAAQLKKTAEQQAPIPANLAAKPAPPKPIAGNNTQGQPSQTDAQSQSSPQSQSAPQGQSSPQGQPRSASAQTTPTPAAQTGSQKSRERQNQSARLQPAPQRAGEESQSSSPTPANSPQKESRDASQERTQNSSKATPTPADESGKREPVSHQQQPRTEQRQPSEKRSSTEDKEKSSAPKERKQTEQGREQPANGSENRTTPRSESQREESPGSQKSEKSEESQNPSDVERRGDQKQPENAKPEQKRSEKKEQKPEQPRKEESSSK